MAKEIESYEIPWRPVYESWSAAAWLAGSCACYSLSVISDLPDPPMWTMTGVAAGMALWRLSQAVPRINARNRLEKGSLDFIKPEDLKKRVKKKINDVWLGKGFEWTSVEAGLIHEIKRRGLDAEISKRKEKKLKKGHPVPEGADWIHGVGKVGDLYQATKNLSLHTLIVGTTGSGKTRLFDLMVTQAVLRGEAVIILDPKGDKDLAALAKKACTLAGSPDKYVYFNAADPAGSACIDPLKNWNRSTEVASRIAALVPSETGADPFTAFAWKAMNDIVNGLILVEEAPNLKRLRHFIEGGPDSLVERALTRYYEKNIRDWETRIKPFVKKAKGNTLQAVVDFYKHVVSAEKPSSEMEGLLSSYTHNREHFQKMIASLIPVFAMLTTGELGDMLSPDPTDADENRLITDTSRIINNGMCCYIGLDSLSDSTVGSAIGSILLADLTAVAGDRYNYGVNNRPVNVVIDECSELINIPTIQLLNKGRGSLFQMHVATQSISDFITRMGSEDAAMQILANCNTKIALRVKDQKTQEYMAKNLPEATIRKLGQSYDSSSEGGLGITGSKFRESVEEEAVELFPFTLFSELPDLQYIAQLAGGRVIKGKIPIISQEN